MSNRIIDGCRAHIWNFGHHTQSHCLASCICLLPLLTSSTVYRLWVYIGLGPAAVLSRILGAFLGGLPSPCRPQVPSSAPWATTQLVFSVYVGTILGWSRVRWRNNSHPLHARARPPQAAARRPPLPARQDIFSIHTSVLYFSGNYQAQRIFHKPNITSDIVTPFPTSLLPLTTCLYLSACWTAQVSTVIWLPLWDKVVHPFLFCFYKCTPYNATVSFLGVFRNTLSCWYFWGWWTLLL